MVSDASGWYARLDRSCENRIEQLDSWLDAWEDSIRHNIPIAATMPSDWPTLPAGLLSNPGAVLDHMLARYDAEIDGRSPRGAYATPARFADAMLADELGERGAGVSTQMPTEISLAALPPGFRAFAAQMNEANSPEQDDELDEAVLDGEKTASGIPLPFADPAVGAGLFPERVLKVHSERIDGMSDSARKEDTIRLLSNMQLLDISEIAVSCTRRRLLLVLAKSGLVDLDGPGDDSRIAREEAEVLLESSVQHGDALRGIWPWNDDPRLLICNPPWLRIKDRFRGHPDGSNLRKELSRELRSITEDDGRLRFSTLLGNVNLYRLFLERSLQLVCEGGRVRMIVPDSLLREKSSVPLRKLIVERNDWESAWSFPESQRVFPGVSQGVLVIGITVGGETSALTSWGPLESSDVLPSSGLDPKAPELVLERDIWSVWTDMNWAVPRMPRAEHERRSVLKSISQLADLPRLSEEHNWLNPSGEPIRVRVGEIDQTTWSSDIRDWNPRSRGTPFIRGIHFNLDGSKVSIKHPGYNSSIPKGSVERSQALWKGPIESRGVSRIACQAIVNAQQNRRLRWVVVPPDCVLGNSVNFLELPEAVQDSLAEQYGTLDDGLLWLAEHLNSDKLDLWSRAWAANNNVNNYEIENLPFPPPVSLAAVQV
ncbi:MAG: Eco57I restriction-modification methylase domain-containing protein [Candidatus Thalassarchaeaceae archaeon]|nr:Eco57I restriction-modification methylase domain-containing protein [Candidatus Thalassarchaeaceae archaeon]